MTLLFLSSASSAQVLPPTLIVSNVSYNAAGQVTQVNFGNGDVTTYTYNNLNLRLTQLKTVKSGGTVVQDLNYTYDAVGNILSITDNVGQADQTFQYDHLNRLTQATGQNYGTKTYSYDAIGNITSKDGLTYTYDNIAGGPHAVTSLSDGTTFTYDDNGNMATRQKASDLWVYTYDAENRLVEVTKNGTVEESYEYDGDGGRTKKLPNGATPNTKFVGQMYEEQGTRKTSYIFLGDQRIAAVTNGAILYFHGDHLGSANVVSDSTGTIKEVSEYEPYGQFSRHEKYGTPEEQAWYYFTNQYLDETTGLYYYGARYYFPLIGRFITADPVTPGVQSQALNRYTYVFNNPVNLTDPTGNFPWPAFVIGAIIGGTSAAIMSYQMTGSINWLSVGLGALMGGLAGATLSPATTAESLGISVMKDVSMGIIKTSAALSLASSVAGAAGWYQGAKIMGDVSRYLGYIVIGMHALRGVKDWAHETRYRFQKLREAGLEEAEHVHINGILTGERKGIISSAIDEAVGVNATFLASNPTSSPVADLTEAFLDKITFTSSVTRQTTQSMIEAGLHGAKLTGFSQGGMIGANVMLQLGLTGHRDVVSQFTAYSTQISQLRVGISGWIGSGVYGVLRQGSIFDFSNVLGPNLNPIYFGGGIIGGSILPIGVRHHYIPN